MEILRHSPDIWLWKRVECRDLSVHTNVWIGRVEVFHLTDNVSLSSNASCTRSDMQQRTEQVTRETALPRPNIPRPFCDLLWWQSFLKPFNRLTLFYWNYWSVPWCLSEMFIKTVFALSFWPNAVSKSNKMFENVLKGQHPTEWELHLAR